MKIAADCNIPLVKECFSTIGEVEAMAGREMTAESVRVAEVLLVRSVTKVDGDLLEGSSVKFVATATIGVEHIDIDYLRSKGIGFASAPGSNANSVAEYVTAGLLEVGDNRGISLAGKSIGIVGVGNVGGKVAEKCRALGMEVCLNDPPLQRQSCDAKYRPIEEVFGCDFVTLHVPLTLGGVDKTAHLAGPEFFESLKEGCVFINTSRGGVVETGALKSALKSGKIAGAIVDVWEDEPSIDSELLEMVDIGTAHIAGYSFDGKVAGLMMIYDSTCRHFALAPSFHVGRFMPAPQVGNLTVKSALENEQKQVLAVVRKVYDICGDGEKLRQILGQPLGKRCAMFDKLRKDYQVRREFFNTQVVLENAGGGLAEKLRGIGFGVSNV
ncbi:MAG: 4-phosphoerythronate dehydrogenase [Planctomycetes bacterium]|nr:4-phosphoerythronate dehydrogenase [Planctomycetota bacterium]